MDTARVYKIKIRENILKQVILTERNVFIGVIVITTFILWNALGGLPTDFKIFISITVSGLILLIFTIKIDRQLVIKLFPRIISYIQRNKKTRF